MQIVRTEANGVTITGNIKTTADYLEIRKMVMEMVDMGCTKLTVRIHESLSMPSSVIGFFVKLVNRDKVEMRMLIQDPRLVELLEELNLSTLFGARHEA